MTQRNTSVRPRHFKSSDIRRYQYASDNILQSYEVYQPPAPNPDTRPVSRYWVLYIHGGAYRDPEITSGSFFGADGPLDHILASRNSETSAHIDGYASINYRLSPHPMHPQDPEKTSAYEMRGAGHPDHLEDIRVAVASLQKRFKFEDRYILVGHSVGATMALQVVLGSRIPGLGPQSMRSEQSPQPSAILGVCGIYDIPELLKSYSHVPIYHDFIVGAFGCNDSLYSQVSPARHRASEYSAAWKKGRLLMLAESSEDELINAQQLELMQEVFRDADSRVATEIRTLQIHGEHDDIWRKGKEMARAVREVILFLTDSDAASS